MTTTAVQCPKCGGPTWDNRVGKKNPKAPDFKCRDKSCDGVIWPPKGAKAAPAPQAAPEFTSPNAPPDWLKDQAQHETQVVATIQQGASTKLQSVFSLYDVCMDHVLTVNAAKLAKAGVEVTDQGISAMTATLMIAAKERGLAA